ncbi:MAG TPA: hypothetical protein VMM78_11705 [Thermomicrobiales bacterium]|nr:hypothetical protein [Thermomicrobiales bacterium]
MQQTFGFKQFVVNHVAATALAASVLVSGALGVAALGVTGNLPWTVGGNGPSVAAQAQAAAAQTARVAQAQRFWEHKEQQLAALSPGEAELIVPNANHLNEPFQP